MRWIILLTLISINTSVMAQGAPTLSVIPQHQVPEGQLFKMQITITGTSYDTLVFMSPNLPENANLDLATGFFSWMPQHEQVGVHAITFILRNSHVSLDTATTNLIVTAIDHAPVLKPLADRTVEEGKRLQIVLAASDLNDGGSFTYLSPDRPTNAELDAERGIFSWIPDHTQTGPHLVTFTVMDETGRQDSQTITITVNEIPHTPVLGTISDQTVNDGERLLFVVQATDRNRGDALTYTASGLPPGAMLNARNGIFSWTPTNNQIGIYIPTINVTDRTGLRDSQRFNIRVNDIRHPPTVRPVGDKTARIGEALIFRITAKDLDGDPLFYTMYNQPLTATLSQDGIFSWTPRIGEISENKPVEITFKVTDSANLTALETVRITIGNIPHPPRLDPVVDQEVREGQELRLTLFATDSDGGPLRFESPTLPPGATLNESTGTFSWTPDYTYVQQGAARMLALRLAVVDPSGLRDEGVVNIRVINATNPTLLREQYRSAFVSSSRLLAEIDYQYNLVQKKTNSRKSWRTRLAIGSIVLGGATPIIQSTSGNSQKWGLTIAGSLTAIIGGITTLLSSEDDLTDELETLSTEREVVRRKGISLLGKYTTNPADEVFIGTSGEALRQDLLEFNEVREEAEENLRDARIVLKPNVPATTVYFRGITQ